MVGEMTAPLVMISLGIYFNPEVVRVRATVVSVSTRMLLGLLAGLTLSSLFGLDGMNRTVALVACSAPLGFTTLTFSAIKGLERTSPPAAYPIRFSSASSPRRFSHFCCTEVHRQAGRVAVEGRKGRPIVLPSPPFCVEGSSFQEGELLLRDQFKDVPRRLASTGVFSSPKQDQQRRQSQRTVQPLCLKYPLPGTCARVSRDQRTPKIAIPDPPTRNEKRANSSLLLSRVYQNRQPP